ncbi:hypothetical protein DV737_g2712, partial [Chaetothyriales sp. CBS 132003]
MSGANYLKNLRRGDLNEIATEANLPNAASYKTKDDLAPALDEHLKANSTTYASSTNKLIGTYYTKTSSKSRSPVKGLADKVSDLVKGDDDQAVVPAPTKQRRRKTTTAPADDTVRAPDRRSSTILQQTQEAVAVSPARVAAAFESQVTTVKAQVSDALDKLRLADYTEAVRDFASTPSSVGLAAGVYEAGSVTRSLVQLKHLHDIQVPSYGTLKVWVPDLFVLLEYTKFWEPALVWLLTSLLLPLLVSYFINIPYLVYAEHFQYFGLFTRVSTVIVNDSFYDNYRNILTTSAVGAAITLYEAVLHNAAVDNVYSAAVDGVYSAAADDVYSTAVDSVYSAAVDSVYSAAVDDVYSAAVDGVYNAPVGDVTCTMQPLESLGIAE